MKNNFLIVAAVLAVIAGVATYYYWPQIQPEPEVAQAKVPQPPPAPPEVHQVIEAPQTAAVLPALPALANSDAFMHDALAGLIANKSLLKFLHIDRFIRHFVATIDNLPGRRAPMSVMPVEQAPGKFVTAGPEYNMTIGPDNASRYTPYVKIAETVDAKQLVGLYVRLYPLFQQAYQELGYPKKYFNDRLIVVLDDLLAAPRIKEPVRLVRPGVYYQYANPDLESRSIGQRILMRMGSKNQASIQAKLREIRKELMLHVHEKKITGNK